MEVSNNNKNRIFTLDLMRTLAIVLMVVFHFIYDLKLFGLLVTGIPDGQGWMQFRWLIISLFFLCLGASLHLTHLRKIKIRKFLIRLVQISAGALIISIGSYYFLPENWIFFGVLHFIAFSSVLALAFIRLPKISLILGLALMFAGAMQWLPGRWPFHLLFDGLPTYTNDYVAIVPWFGMVLIGVYLGSTAFLKADPLAKLLSKQGHNRIAWPGKHSLIIYLLHQPILIGLLQLYTLIWNS